MKFIKNTKTQVVLLLQMIFLLQIVYSEQRKSSFSFQQERRQKYAEIYGLNSQPRNKYHILPDIYVDVAVQATLKSHTSSKKKTEEELRKIRQLITTDIKLGSKFFALLKEAEINIKALRQCANKDADIITLIAINELSFTQSSVVDKEFQKLKYEIQQIIYEPDGIIFEGSGKFKLVLTDNDVKKINAVIDKFEAFLHDWMHNKDNISSACDEKSYQANEPCNLEWDRKIKSNSYNRDVFKVHSLCSDGHVKLAKQIVKGYESCFNIRNWKINDEKHLEYAHLNYIVSKFEMDRYCESGNIRAAEQILDDYENRYKEHWSTWDIVKRIHHSNLQSIYKRAEKEFRISSLSSAAKSDPVLAEKIWREQDQISNTLKANVPLVELEAKKWGEHQQDKQYEDRLKSWQESVTKQKITAQNYELTQEGQALYRELELDDEAFTHCYGDQFQHTLHAEFVTLANKAGLINAQTTNLQAREFAKEIAIFTDAGSNCLKTGHVLQAVYAADFCWSLLDCAVAVMEGAAEGAITAVHLFTESVKTVKNIGEAVNNTAHCLAKILSFLELEDEDFVFRDPEGWKQLTAERRELYTAFIDYFSEPRNAAKEVTAIGTCGWATGKLLGATGKFFSDARHKIYEMTKKGILGTAEEAAVVAAEGLPVQFKIVEEATHTLVEKTGKGALGEAELLAARNYIIEVEQLVNVEHKIPRLRQLFDGTRKGFDDFANKTIKLDYKHMLAPEFEITKKGGIKLSGFHHDPGLVLEKSGLIKITDKFVDKHGIYRANVWCNGVKWPKTFFPSHWAEEQIFRKVLEAYDNFILSGAKNFVEKNGKILVEAYTSEGILIRMHITKNGRLRGFPIIE